MIGGEVIETTFEQQLLTSSAPIAIQQIEQGT